MGAGGRIQFEVTEELYDVLIATARRSNCLLCPEAAAKDGLCQECFDNLVDTLARCPCLTRDSLQASLDRVEQEGLPHVDITDRMYQHIQSRAAEASVSN